MTVYIVRKFPVIALFFITGILLTIAYTAMAVMPREWRNSCPPSSYVGTGPSQSRHR